MIKLNEGDTLAIKIENYNKEFDGKYFLFIKAEDFSEKYDSTASKKLFRAKIIDSIDNIDFNILLLHLNIITFFITKCLLFIL